MNITVQIDIMALGWAITLTDGADTLKELRMKELYCIYKN